MPLSCSRRIAMICSSVNLDRLIVRLLQVTDSTQIWRNFRGSGQIFYSRTESCPRFVWCILGQGVHAAQKWASLRTDEAAGFPKQFGFNLDRALLAGWHAHIIFVVTNECRERRVL